MPSGTYPRKSIEERFWSKVKKTKNCWFWQAGISRGGYGQFTPSHGKNTRAHRFAYELLKGKILDGLTIDHLCRNRACVNPAHLEAVTLKENVLRGVGLTAQNAKKTECHHGHKYTKENTGHDSKGRYCRICKRSQTLRGFREKGRKIIFRKELCTPCLESARSNIRKLKQ